MEDFTLSKKDTGSRFAQASIAFAKLSIVWLLIMFVLSLFEVIYNGAHHHLSSSFILVLFWAWLNDLLFWLKLLLVLYIIFVILFLVSRKFSERIYGAFILIMVAVQFLFTLYFASAAVPYGADMPAGHKQSLGDVTGFLSILSLLIILGASAAALWFLPRRFHFNRYLAVLLPIISFFIILGGWIGVASPADLNSQFTNDLATNKTDYFWASSYNRSHPKPHELDIYADNYITDYSNSSTDKLVSFKYVDPLNYPFLHTDSEKDVLTPFLNHNAAPPNIVIIVVEGLGRAYSNDGAYLGNFTPFIDSLSGKSLYWKNFLSEEGTTFTSLPSILGSLPFGKSGFLEAGNSMPQHLSILSLLKYNGYHTSFYYGGNSHSQNMDIFMHKNHVDELNDERSFAKNGGYDMIPAAKGASWGYDDKSVFKHFLDTRKETDTVPQLSVIVTGSTRAPYALKEQDKYSAKFETRLKQLNFNEAEKAARRTYKAEYASILYLDDALSGFINAYSKRADFKNTIFLITGNHRMTDIPVSDKLDPYHVPFIIYSPLLKQSLTISSVSTHFDIAPSLLVYLHNNYKTKGPAYVSWLGQGLDTNHNIRNLHNYPLLQDRGDGVLDFVSGSYHLNEGHLFKVNSEFGEEAVQSDDATLNQLQTALDLFKGKNSGVMNGNHIIPDSISKIYNSVPASAKSSKHKRR